MKQDFTPLIIVNTMIWGVKVAVSPLLYGASEASDGDGGQPTDGLSTEEEARPAGERVLKCTLPFEGFIESY